MTQGYPRRLLEYHRPSLLDQYDALERFADQLETRRSVRDFSPDPVPLDLIDQAIMVAGGAPSGANQQPWTFVVVTDPALKSVIREAAEAEEHETYAHRLTPEWRSALEPLGTDWRKPHLTDAPVLIVVFEQVYGLQTGQPEKTTHYYTKESVGIAVGFLLAALHMAGLGTLTHTPSPMGFLQTILDRPVNERAYVLIPVGYPVPDCWVPDIAKKSLDDIRILK